MWRAIYDKWAANHPMTTHDRLMHEYRRHWSRGQWARDRLPTEDDNNYWRGMLSMTLTQFSESERREAQKLKIGFGGLTPAEFDKMFAALSINKKMAEQQQYGHDSRREYAELVRRGEETRNMIIGDNDVVK